MSRPFAFRIALLSLLLTPPEAALARDPRPPVALRSAPRVTDPLAFSPTTSFTTPDGFTHWRKEIDSDCEFDDFLLSLEIDQEPGQLSDITLTMTNYDVDWDDPQDCAGGPEVDLLHWNGVELGLLTGADDSLSVNTFPLSQSQVVKGSNEIVIDTDAARTDCWCVGVGTLELQARVGFAVVRHTPQTDDKNRDYHAAAVDLQVTFSRPYEPGTLNAATFQLEHRAKSGDWVRVPGSFEALSPESFRFVPAGDLLDGVRYRATVQGGETGILSKGFAALEDNVEWHFSTVPDLDRVDAFDYGKTSTCGPSASPCPGVELVVTQVSRNEAIVPGKPAVGRVYVRWNGHDEVFPADQVKELEVEGRLVVGDATFFASGNVKRPDTQTLAEIRAAENTLNLYYTPGSGSHALRLTPRPQSNASPVTFDHVLALSDVGRSPRLEFDHYFLADGPWAAGVPDAAEAEGLATMSAGVLNTTDQFPVLSTTFDEKGEFDIGYTYTGVEFPGSDCGAVREVECPIGFFQTARMPERACIHHKFSSVLGSRKFLAITVPPTFCTTAVGVAMDLRLYLHVSGAGNPETVPHEIGHIHGISQANSPTPYHRSGFGGIEGFQVRTRKNRSFQEGTHPISLMHPNQQPTGTSWIDAADYRSLLDANVSQLAPALRSRALGVGDHVVVSGAVDFVEGVAFLEPAHLEEVPSGSPAPGSTCRASLVDEAGGVLASRSFDPGQQIIAEQASGHASLSTLDTLGTQVFRVSLPWDERTARIALACGTIAAELVRTRPPAVDFVDLADGSILTGLQEVRWIGLDLDGPGIAYQLQFRPAGETDWQPLLPLDVRTAFSLDTTKLPSGAGHTLRVLATDGVDTVYATRSVRIENPLARTGLVPADGATGVARDTDVSMRFSGPIDVATLDVNLSSPTLVDLPVDVRYDPTARLLSLRPKARLEPQTRYTLAVHAESPAGSLLELSAFTTDGDTEAPRVARVSPAPDSVDAAPDGLVTVRFNEEMFDDSIHKNSFRLFDAAGNAVPARVVYAYAAPQGVLTPLVPLSPGERYTARVTTAVADAAWNVLEQNHEWSFTVGKARAPRGVRILGNYSDRGNDEDGDGTFESLSVFVDVEIEVEDLYNLNGRLVDGDGELIGWSSTGLATLPEGTSRLELVFPGARLRSNDRNGPYVLDSLHLYARDDESLADVALGAHHTFAYDVDDFQSTLTLGDLPDQRLEVGVRREGAFNLRSYTRHESLPVSDVAYQILVNTDPRIGLAIDADGDVSIDPTPGLELSSQITIEARDPLGNRVTSRFTVSVERAHAAGFAIQASATMTPGASQEVRASLLDQFGRLFVEPTALAFAITGGASVTPAAMQTTGGVATAVVTAGSSAGRLFLTVTAGAASKQLVLDVLAPATGDLDADGDVDVLDVNLVLAARDHPVSGSDDPRDLDGDGTITTEDARALALLCTRPWCSPTEVTPTESRCGLGFEVALLLPGFAWLSARRRERATTRYVPLSVTRTGDERSTHRRRRRRDPRARDSS